MKVECPSCSRMVDAGADVRKGVLICPMCEAEIPYESQKTNDIVVEEIMPGVKPGARLGAYEVIEFLGSGGMAVIVKGRQLSLNRIVAVKILPKRFAGNKMFVARFDQEASAMASLSHHNIVNVIDRGREGDIYYIVMEYIEGEDLKARIARQERLSQAEAITICQQALAGLDYAHSKGIVHRDIKPGNIMISGSGIVKVADFGLAHLADERDHASRTHTGQCMGTLKYMAPEQLVDAKSVDARADIYSVGVVLYEMLTGYLPIGAFKLPSDHIPELDIRLDDIVLRALRSDPEERFKSARELSDALQEVIAAPLSQPAKAQQNEFRGAAPASDKGSELAACKKCGADNPKEARACGGCGNDLSYLFEKCPQCEREVRFDVLKCPGCGNDMSVAKQKKRRRVMNGQRLINDLMAKREFERAISELRKLKDIEGVEYEEVRRSAVLWLEKLEKTVERRNQQIYDAAQRMFAEADHEKALGYLKQLPSDYKNTGELIDQVNDRLNSGREIAERAKIAAKEGKLEDALALWEQAADLRPRDAGIKNNILQLRMRLGNRNLVRAYLDDAKTAAQKKNYAEVLALCRRASELAPDDDSVIALTKELEKEASSFSPSDDPPSAPTATVNKKTKKRIKIAPYIGKTALLLFVATALIAIIWLIVHITPTQAERAEARMQKAADSKAKGELEDAIAIYAAVFERYPQSDYAASARKKHDYLSGLLEECLQLLDKAHYHETAGEWKEAGMIYRQIISHEDYSRSVRYKAIAREELRNLRDKLISESAELEKNMRLTEALELLEVAREMAILPEAPSSAIVSGERRIRELLSYIDNLAWETELAIENKQPEEAENALRRLMATLPEDERLKSLIDRTLDLKSPPDGMVYAPPGEFKVRYGADGADIEPIAKSIESGYYIGVFEVTNEQYAEFVNDAGRPAPPHWEGGEPPPGEEKHPVVNVSYQDATDYAAWAGGRLPTSIEWLRAAGGEEGRRYPWGEEWDMSKTVSSTASAPVGAVKSDVSPVGCRDMGGNVSEWIFCAAEGNEGRRVVMGGSFIGAEQDRPMPPVFGRVEESRVTFDYIDPPLDLEPLDIRDDKPVVSLPIALTGIAGHPKAALLMVSNPIFTRPRISGVRERAGLTMFKWMPEDRVIISAPIVANMNGEISGRRMVRIPSAIGSERRESIEFKTDCIFIGWKDCEDIDELVMIYRDPGGLIRELSGEEEPDAAIISSRFIDLQSRFKIPLKRTMSVNYRRSAPEEGKYINVGFRIAKTPELVTLHKNAFDSTGDFE